MWLCNVSTDGSQYEPEEGASWSIMIPLYIHGIAWHMVNKVIYCHIPVCSLNLTCLQFHQANFCDLQKKYSIIENQRDTADVASLVVV